MRLLFHPVFKDDLDEATQYHNEQCEGLGLMATASLRRRRSLFAKPLKFS